MCRRLPQLVRATVLGFWSELHSNAPWPAAKQGWLLPQRGLKYEVEMKDGSITEAIVLKACLALGCFYLARSLLAWSLLACCLLAITAPARVSVACATASNLGSLAATVTNTAAAMDHDLAAGQSEQGHVHGPRRCGRQL